MTIRGGGNPHSVMAAMPLREWTRRLGALPAEAYDCFMVGTPYGFSLAGDRRLSLFHQVDKLPPAVAPAGRFKDRSRLPLSLVELVVSIKGIGLHEAHIAGKMALRMLPGTTARRMERRRRWVPAAERPVVADIGPDPAGDSL